MADDDSNCYRTAVEDDEQTVTSSRADRLKHGIAVPAPTLIGGFALLVIVTVWLSVLSAGPGVLAVDLTLARFVQNHPFLGSHAIAVFGNTIGTAKVGVPLGLGIAAIFAWHGRPRAAYLMVAATGLRLVDGLLKLIVDSPRPSANLVHVNESASGLGFPSGHVMSATLLCGALLLALWSKTDRRGRILLSTVATLIVLATAYGRVSVGAHWPSDTLGGALWAVILLALPAARYSGVFPTRDGTPRAK